MNALNEINPRYWRFCGKCGNELIRNNGGFKAFKPYRFDRISGKAFYFISVRCPNWRYRKDGHSSDGYETDDPMDTVYKEIPY
jgi:hypothetical protein